MNRKENRRERNVSAQIRFAQIESGLHSFQSYGEWNSDRITVNSDTITVNLNRRGFNTALFQNTAKNMLS